MVASIGAIGAILCAAPTHACSFPRGQRVVLAANDMDPDVFVWDSRQRASAYATGVWRSTRDVMHHSSLVRPGTHALVLSCSPNVIRSRYSDLVEDAIGLRILDGPVRGRLGWVHSEDVHQDRPPIAKART